MPAPATILIVDDNSLMLLTLTRILEQHGYLVLGASSGHTALQLVRARTVDLVIMDYNLPDGRGQLGSSLKQTRPGLPIVVLSGDPEAAQAVEFADLLLPKPQEPDKLMEKINRLLRERGKTRAA